MLSAASTFSSLRSGENTLKVYFHSPIKVDLPKYDSLPYRYEAVNDQSANGGLSTTRQRLRPQGGLPLRLGLGSAPGDLGHLASGLSGGLERRPHQ